jgi:hypothetical protein
MAAKFGGVLVLIVFGFLMFMAGALAPESLRKPLGQWAARVTAERAKVAVLAAGVAAAVPAAPAVKTVAAATAARVGPLAEAADPVLADTLLIPTPLSDKAQYALQVGEFTSGDAADALAQRIKALHLPSTPVIDVVDRSGMRSRVVPVGPYTSLADARMAGPAVARELGLGEPLPLMLLPIAAAPVPAPARASR